jgi:hypothetical protein
MPMNRLFTSVSHSEGIEVIRHLSFTAPKENRLKIAFIKKTLIDIGFNGAR